MEKRSISELSIDTQVLYNRLSQCQQGDFVTYEELSELIDRNVQKEAYGNLMTAKKMMQRQHNIVFDPVIGKGLLALTDEENVNSTGDRYLKKIRNLARNASKRITAISDFNGLSNEAKVKHNANLGIMGAFMLATKKKTVAKIENTVKQSGEKIGINKTIELFK